MHGHALFSKTCLRKETWLVQRKAAFIEKKRRKVEELPEDCPSSIQSSSRTGLQDSSSENNLLPYVTVMWNC